MKVLAICILCVFIHNLVDQFYHLGYEKGGGQVKLSFSKDIFTSRKVKCQEFVCQVGKFKIFQNIGILFTHGDSRI